MGAPQKLITDKIYKQAKEALEKVTKENRVAIRLRAIVSAKEHGVKLVAKIFGVSDFTIREWVKSFASGNLSDLDYSPGRGRKSNLSDKHIELIKRWVAEDSSVTLAIIVTKLQNDCGLKTSKSSVHRILEKLRLSYITPRPAHYKKNESEASDFKKKSRE